MCVSDKVLLVPGVRVHMATSTSCEQLCESLVLCDINCKVVVGLGVSRHETTHT